MKKLLVIVSMMIFVSSLAFAAIDPKKDSSLDYKPRDASFLTFEGYFEVEGRNFNNSNLWKGSKGKKSDSNYYQHLRIITGFQIDSKTKITTRINPVQDYIWSKTDGDTYKPLSSNLGLDRAWISYDVSNMLNVQLGNMTGNDMYISDFGPVHYDQGTGATGLNQIQVTVKPNDMFNVYGVVIKKTETQASNGYEFGNTQESRDSDIYILGTDVYGVTEGLDIRASVGYGTDLTRRSYARMTAYAGASYDNPMFWVKGALAVDSTKWNKAKNAPDNATGNDAKNSITLYGVFVEGAYKHSDMLDAGLTLAYASAQKEGTNKTAAGFAFGDDFDKTYIIEDKIFDGSGAIGLSTIQAFVDAKVMPEVKLSARAAYYMSNYNGKGTLDTKKYNLVGKKFNAFEIDASAAYAWTDATTFTVGAAFAQLDKVGADGKATQNDKGKNDGKVDPIYAFYWNAKTVF